MTWENEVCVTKAVKVNDSVKKFIRFMAGLGKDKLCSSNYAALASKFQNSDITRM